ncbi:MAG: adk [Candidatus Saccharibacteria bacterium]|nr:adk [Candidatus Saccharibacteria bacterium]
MIYLIGGAPRVGKSLVASQLVAAKPMPSFSLDFLYNLSQITSIEAFSGASILEKGRLFYPTLKELLVDVSRRSENCIIDGEVILPEFISELSERYDIKCCFLGLSETSLEKILEHGGYFNWPKWKMENGFEDEVEDLAEQTVGRSLIIQEQAKKYGLPYYDLAADYNHTSKAALQSLLS